MKPKPFVPEIYKNDEKYVRDQTTGLIWHRAKHRTLYADTDRSQVVYHSNYLRYFEFGRTSLMRDVAYSYKAIEESGYVYPIIDLGITFYQSLYYDDLMYIYTRPVNLERVRLQFDYVVTNAEAGHMICVGYTKHCAANTAGRPVAVDPKTVELWKTFPRQNIKNRFSSVLLTRPYFRDHCFDGKTIVPAVEAQITLASAVKSHHPQAALNHLTDIRFPRILAIEPAGEQQDVQIEIETQACGISASLLTSIQVKNSTIRRTLEHARMTFVQNTVLPEPEMSFQTAQKLETACIHIPAVSIYRELIPFGLSYQNIIGDLSVSPEGALADISGGGGEADDSFLGSPFVLDATMHAACVWGQRFTGIVPFPVGFDERRIYRPTRKGATYLSRIAPVDVGYDSLIFDAWIFDQNGVICESIRSLRMRDITRGRMRPPAWIKGGAWKKSF